MRIRAAATLLLLTALSACADRSLDIVAPSPEGLRATVSGSVCGVEFSGRRWCIRDAFSAGPGPNRWDARNAWVDAAGALHLRIVKRNGVWTSAEVYTEQPLGFGTYQFDVASRLDNLDRNVVLGLFTYPSTGLDGTHEIDIEFARWGVANGRNWHVRVWPTELFSFSTPVNHREEYWKRKERQSTHRFTWTPTAVSFESLAGGKRVLAWSYVPGADAFRYISQQPWPLHMNLWLFGGRAPASGRETEVVITAFRFTPL